MYITLLKLVEAPVFNISKEAQIPRTSAYTALEKLKSKGFVTSFKKNNVQFFTPENPNVLLEELDKKKQLISKIIPDLSDLIDTAKIMPEIKLFKDKKGYILARKSMLETFKKEKIKQIIAISSPEDFEVFPKFFPEWVEKRKGMGVSVKMLLRHDAKAHKNFQSNEKDLRIVKYLPIDFQFRGTINIYGNKIALFSLENKELTSIIIESKTLANMLNLFFNFTWSAL